MMKHELRLLYILFVFLSNCPSSLPITERRDERCPKIHGLKGFMSGDSTRKICYYPAFLKEPINYIMDADQTCMDYYKASLPSIVGSRIGYLSRITKNFPRYGQRHMLVGYDSRISKKTFLDGELFLIGKKLDSTKFNASTCLFIPLSQEQTIIYKDCDNLFIKHFWCARTLEPVLYLQSKDVQQTKTIRRSPIRLRRGLHPQELDLIAKQDEKIALEETIGYLKLILIVTTVFLAIYVGSFFIYCVLASPEKKLLNDGRELSADINENSIKNNHLLSSAGSSFSSFGLFIKSISVVSLDPPRCYQIVKGFGRQWNPLASERYCSRYLNSTLLFIGNKVEEDLFKKLILDKHYITERNFRIPLRPSMKLLKKADENMMNVKGELMPLIALKTNANLAASCIFLEIWQAQRQLKHAAYTTSSCSELVAIFICETSSLNMCYKQFGRVRRKESDYEPNITSSKVVDVIESDALEVRDT
uniref:CUB domain-containing protein n=1 Tax=Syphacia muris TaxID=451379 RepID=A0A0N5ANN9_9BILA